MSDSTTTSPDSITVLSQLRYGSTFKLRGKLYTVRTGGSSYWSADSSRGECAVLPIWRSHSDGKASTITVRPDSRVEVLHECAPWCPQHGSMNRY